MALREYSALLRGTIASIVVASALVTGVEARAQTVPSQDIQFDIPAESLQSALIAFGSTTGWQLIYTPAAVAERRTSPLRGRFSAFAALEKLIADTGLRIKRVSPKVVILEMAQASTGPAATAVQPAMKDTAPPLEAMADAGSQDVERNTEIVVTGSNIRGGAPVGSNIRTIGRREIEENGYSTVGQVLQSLPGNFGGSATEQSALSSADLSGTNASLATGVNLRGLGASATLVLLNGRRIASAGTLGDFADVSSIPMSVVERVEVLMDGASAIYGSDAVGGVINIIMKVLSSAEN